MDERAEPLIAEIYRQKRALESLGITPERVILPEKWITLIKEYHKNLGKISGPVEDYIGKNSIFGLEFYIDNSESIEVK